VDGEDDESNDESNDDDNKIKGSGRQKGRAPFRAWGVKDTGIQEQKIPYLFLQCSLPYLIDLDAALG